MAFKEFQNILPLDHQMVSVYEVRYSVVPDLIRHPDAIPTKFGNHLKVWIPVFTGNPGFRLFAALARERSGSPE